MSIDFGSILGGFAEQGVKDFDKAEERMGKLVEKTFDKWLVDGPANFKAHVSKKKALRTLAKRLEGYNLSPDKIGIILEQGRGEEVTKYLDNISSLTGEAKKKYLEPLGGEISNIVKFAEGYEESGLTVDQIVEKVGGKISGGMSLTDAFADVGQSSKNTFANLLIPSAGKLANRQRKLYESIYGKEALDQARIYATGAVKTESLPENLNPYTGISSKDYTFTTPDLLASQKVMDALGDDGGTIGFSTTKTTLRQTAADLIDGLTFDQETQGFTTTPEFIAQFGADAKNEMNNIILDGLAEIDANRPKNQRGTYSLKHINEIKEGLKKFRDSKLTPDSNNNDTNRTAREISVDIDAARKEVETAGFTDSDFDSATWKANYVRLLQEQERAEGKTPSSIEFLMTAAEKAHDDELMRGRNKVTASTDSTAIGGYALEGQSYRDE